MPIKETRDKRQETREFGLKGKTFLLLASCFLHLSANAQCAMCRASLESEGNKVKAEAVNDGIVLLMAVPYLIVALIGFAIYKMYYKKKSNKDDSLAG